MAAYKLSSSAYKSHIELIEIHTSIIVLDTGFKATVDLIRVKISIFFYMIENKHDIDRCDSFETCTLTTKRCMKGLKWGNSSSNLRFSSHNSYLCSEYKFSLNKTMSEIYFLQNLKFSVLYEKERKSLESKSDDVHKFVLCLSGEIQFF